jgi:hypothetical protein
MKTQDILSESTPNGRQKQAITTVVSQALGNEIIQDLGWSWNNIAATCIPGSDFDQVHRSASVYLYNLTRHPDFLTIRTSKSIPPHAVFLVDEGGRLYYSWPNSSTLNDATTAWFSPMDITSHVLAIATINEELKRLANMAKLTGGWIATGDKVVVSQWLRFHDLPLPTDEESTKALIDLLNFAVMPDLPDTGNYWELLDAPEDSPFELTKSKRAIIRDITAQLTGNEMPLAEYFGASLVLENAGSDKQPQSLEYRLQRLISDARLQDETGQNYIDALGWFTDESGPKASKQFVDQLLIAAMLLDLDPEIDTANTTLAGFNFYSSAQVQRRPCDVRNDLEAHLIQRFKLDKLIAPLVAELALAGMAPEYLVRELPPSLEVGTPGWVILCQAVGLAESIVPGCSRRMTYEHLLGFSPISGLTPQLNDLHAMAGIDPVVTWALMNGLIQRDADGNLSFETINKGIKAYNEHVETLSTALNAINKPIPRRKALALKELTSVVPACDPHERLVKHRDSGGGGGREVSVLDLYMSDQLHTQDWGRTRGQDIYQEFPRLKQLYPVADLYETAVHNHYSDLISGLSTTIRYVFSQLEESNRRFIEHGRLAIYRVEAYKQHFYAGSIPEATRERTGRYGVIICAEYQGTLVRCFELFPLRSECRSAPELREKVGQYLFTYGQDGIRGNFIEDNSFQNAPLDLDAYLENAAPRSDTTSSVFVRKIGEFDSASHPTLSNKPMAYFNAERIKAISDLIAEQHPFLTESELADMGRDSTEQELASEKFDVIFNTLLNLIIPFKECIEGLSSGIPARQRDAIASCVMDAAAVAFVFASVPAQVGKAVGKSASLATKLLSASRIGTRTVVSLLNPLDGIPTLLNGGVKLIGRGAIKFAGHTAAAAHIVRAQLYRLTGAHSYNLLRALYHTGAAARIRISLDTVAHARALFKSDGLETAEHVLKHLQANSAKLPKNVPQTELQHLLEGSLTDLARQSDTAQSLKKVLDSDVVDSLIRQQAQKFSLDNLRQFKDHTTLPELFNDLLEVEYKNLTAMNQHQKTLLASDLGKAPYSGFLDDVSFNPDRLTDNADRAAAWILKASSSRNEVDNIRTLLREFSGNGKSLTDPAVYKELHRRLVPEATDALRSPTAQARYPSNVSGAAMLEKHLAVLDSAHEYFGKQMLGAFLGYHSFIDGNGRTARAIYAIAELRTNRFNALPLPVENALSGLG